MKIRIFTLIILSCLVLLAVKAAGIMGQKQSIESLLFPPLNAEEKKSDEKEEKNKKAEKKDKEKEDKEEKKEEKVEEKKTEGKDEKSEAKSEQKEIKEQKLSEFSKTEIEILQQLSKRREKLEEWESDLAARENILNLTQTRIDQKIVELRNLKSEVEKILAEYNQKEDQKVMSLVKIYENMKPKSAADIFAGADRAMLLQVISKMKEAKVAAILGQMDPKIAQEITTEFASYRKLPEQKMQN